MPSAVDWLVQDLKHRGIGWVAMLTGHGLDPFLEASSRAGLRVLDTRTEQAASYAAEAYGRLTRKAGVCVVSSGIGHINALSGLAMAWADGTPMILLSGAGALRTAGMGHYQDMDQAAVAAPIAKWSRVIDCPERVRQILDDAFARAAGPVAGPVHLTFPLDIQRAEVAPESLVPPVPRPAVQRLEDGVETVVRVLNRSTRPVIVAGSGVYYNGTSLPLIEFAERCSIPILQPIFDRGIVDRPSQVFVGLTGASSGGPRILEDADCIIMAGAAPDYRVGYLQPPVVGKNAAIAFVERTWPEAWRFDYGAWLEEARTRAATFRHDIEQRAAEQARDGLHARDILNAIRGLLTDKTCLLIDGGAISQWAHLLLCDRYPGNWLTNGRSGAIGWGLGAAIGARIAFPEDPVVLLSGDGAFTFTLAEIETAVRHKLHFVAIVADDQGWGLMRASLGPVKFAEAAKALGARGVVACTPDAVRAELAKALGEEAVTVIHAPIVGGNPS